MTPSTTPRDSARAADELARAQRRPITQVPAPKLRDLLCNPPLVDAIADGMARQAGRVISKDEQECMDAIERACETDSSN